MSYSLSEAALKQVEDYLHELVNTNEEQLIWEVGDSRKFAYCLRQGIKAADKLQKPILAGLKFKWIITEKGNKVIAKRRSTGGRVTPIGNHRKEFPGIVALADIVMAAIANTHFNILYFPDLSLTVGDVAHLEKWTKAKGWEYNPDHKELRKWETETKQSESL